MAKKTPDTTPSESAPAESITSPTSDAAADAYKRGQTAGIERFHVLMDKGHPRMNAYHKALKSTRSEPGDDFSAGWDAGVRNYHALMNEGYSRAESYKLALEKI